MTSLKIDSSSFTLNDFPLVYLNFILLPYSKSKTFSWQSSLQNQDLKTKRFVTLDLNLFILRFDKAYSSRFFTKILFDVVKFLLNCQQNQQNNTSFHLN